MHEKNLVTKSIGFNYKEKPYSVNISYNQNVIDFYEKHLEPGKFIRKVENAPAKNVSILYYTEMNVAKNAKKLNKHSVLMRDTTIPLSKKSLRYKAMQLLGRRW